MLKHKVVFQAISLTVMTQLAEASSIVAFERVTAVKQSKEQKIAVRGVLNIDKSSPKLNSARGEFTTVLLPNACVHSAIAALQASLANSESKEQISYELVGDFLAPPRSGWYVSTGSPINSVFVEFKEDANFTCELHIQGK